MTDPREIEHCTDLGNGRRFAARHGAVARYVADLRLWRLWDGRRWAEDRAHRVEQLAKETAISIYKEAERAADSAQKLELARHAARSESLRAQMAMITMARSERSIASVAADYDPDPMLVTCNNGTIDLRTGHLRAHNPGDCITRLAPVAFDPTATCPLFLAFLDQVLGGDVALIRYAQLAMGYSLTGLTIEQVVFMLYGAGANGKTTLLELIFSVFGDYSARADFSMVLLRRSDGPRNDLAMLPGARFVVASEAGEGQRFDEAKIKEISGGDTITCRRLYADLFSYRPAFKLWLATNAKPELRSTGEAIWRRLRLIPFAVTIPEAERDPNLLQKLSAELPGVLRWAIDGALAWQRDGLGQPPAVRLATEEYRAETDVLAAFLSEECRIGSTEKVAATRLFQTYIRWADASSEPGMSQRAFGIRLTERGFHRVRGTGGRWSYIGLTLGKPAPSDGVTDSDLDSQKFPYEGEPREVPENGKHSVTPSLVTQDDTVKA